MKIERFEDLDCWRAARELVKIVYSLSGKKPFFHDFSLRDQIQKAAISTMANIAEGFASYFDPEFIRFLGFSSRSAIEIQSHLYAALDLEYINEDDFKKAYEKAQDCSNLCRGLIRYLKEKK